VKNNCVSLTRIFILWLCLFGNAAAQNKNAYVFRQLDSRSGISNSSVNHIYQDSDHLLWVSTWDGLNVFDGDDFHVFNYSSRNSSAHIGNNVILRTAEDLKGNLWITTIEGVSKYDKRIGRFSHYFYQSAQENKVSESEFTIAIDLKGEVYCLSKKYGLMVFDAGHDQFIQCELPQVQEVVKINFDSKNRLWAMYKQGQLKTYEIHSGGFQAITTFKTAVPVSDFFVVNGAVMALTTEQRLLSINKELKTVKSIPLENEVRDITLYKNHYLIAWKGKGYGMYDLNFDASDFLKQVMMPASTMKINQFFVAADQVLWLATDGSGMVSIFEKEKKFGTIAHVDQNNYTALKQVRCFTAVNGNLWIGTKGNGIISFPDFSAATGRAGASTIFQSPGALSNNSVYALLTGKDGIVYIGSDGEGLGLYDQRTRQFIKWNEILNASSFPVFSSVYSIIQEKDHSVWLGTSGYGLIHLKIIRQNGGHYSLSYFKQYTFNGKSGPGNDIICFLAEGNDNRIWLGCRYGGLSVLDKNTQNFRTFKAFSNDNSLSHNDVLSLYKDKKDRLWVGTSYGLNWMNENKAFTEGADFKRLTIENGLPNNTIHAIQEDEDNQIWVSTNKGLARINPATLQIERFQESDGLQSNEFCDGAVWKNAQGYLMFGGILGLNYFKPEMVSSSGSQTNVLISRLQLGGELYHENSLRLLHPGQQRSEILQLEAHHNYFDFDVKSINFLSGDKSEYAYYLEGYDQGWHYSGTSVKISYFSIPPGNYTMKIKWSNGEGKWTAETEVFRLQVAQFFWLSWPALILYMVMLGIGIYTLYSYRRNKTEMKHRLVTERMVNLKKEEVHNEQLSFFTNITHELKTPLTLINGSIERFFYKNNRRVEQPKEYYFLSIMHQQSSRLTYLVNQLLDFRKAEAGHLTNQYIYLDISALLSGIAELFLPLCYQKNLDFTIAVDSHLIGWMDKDKMEKIIFNLLSNAFKHSDQNQQIIFKVSGKNGVDSLEIIVKNSGCRLSADQLVRIFDNFFVVDSNQHDQYSNGIGLAFTRQLVTLLNGEIGVSNEGSWITFRTVLPLSTAAYNHSKGLEKGPVKHSPSYLLRAIAAKPDDRGELTVKENNKRALISELEATKHKSILIVDDEPAIRYLLKDLLEENYIVYEAENGRQAIELLKVISPQLIISDIMMPDIDGLELCNKVKNSSDTCHIPFMLLSARGSMDQKTEGYDAGADAYIPKPFDTMHLLVRVRKLLEYQERLHDLFKKDGPQVSLEEKNLADSDKQFLNRLVQLIEENVEDTNLDAGYLESNLAMSKMQLYRKLKTLSNMTPNEFIKHIRLQRTISLLQNSQLTVSEIFYRSGFNNQSYFFREFKKRFQCSPNEYRAQQRIHA